MPKAEGKSSGMFGRGLASRQLSSSPTGILVYMYGDLHTDYSDQTMSLQQYEHSFSAEELCNMAADKLGISPLTAPLLALTTQTFDMWFAPNEKIQCCHDNLQEFVLRVRFIPSESMISRLPAYDAPFFNYLFLQMRSDFINDHIVYREKSLGQEYLLGLGVIDMVRYGKQHHIDLSGLRRLEPQDFIPLSAKGNFKFFWDKKRLQVNFSPHLQREYERYVTDSEVSTKLTYMKSILSYSEHYGMETFHLHTSYSSSKQTVITVKPHDAKQPGLNITCGKDVFYASLCDLMDISISEDPAGLVHINRKTGMPRVVEFPDRQTALCFVSLVDGYYRLQVDYHHHLCKDVESPTIQHLRTLRSHGPVSRDWASERLLERWSHDPTFNYLLRQSDREFGGFTLVVVANSKAVFLHITRLASGQYQLSDVTEPQFNSVSQLLDYYRRPGSDTKLAITLTKCVYPTKPLDTRLYLCRQDSKSADELNGTVQLQKAPQVCLISGVKCLDRLGNGAMSEVWSSVWAKDSATNNAASVSVAVKRLREDALSLQQYWSSAIHCIIFWHHPTILPVHGVCLASPMSLVMDVAPLGCLDVYLRNSVSTRLAPRVSHLVLAAEQIAQALCYLEGRLEVHGNIRCRNILVFKHEPKGSFNVKLADPGLVYYYNTLPISDGPNTDRLPWLAPELYSSLSAMTPDSDLYSFGITLWEMFAFGSRPFNTLRLNQIIEFVLGGRLLPKPECCPDDMYNIVRSCCDLTAENRDRPRVIIRNIRSLLTREGDIYNEYNDLQWLDRATASGSVQQGRTAASSSVQQMASVAGDAALSSSAAAAADNEHNAHLANTFHHLSVNVAAAGSVNDVSVVSPASELSSNGWGDDSQTPLLRHVDCPTSPTLSAGDVSATLSDNTVTTSAGSNTSTTPAGDDGRVVAIQSRPLPEPPTVRALDTNRLQYDMHEKPLGQGHYGEVLRGRFQTDNGDVIQVAIKRLKQTMYKKFEKEFEKEFRIMVRLEHPNIVQIIGQCLTDDSQPTMLLVMEYVSNGCLREYLKRNESRLGVRELLRFGLEIAHGMVYLSREKIVHRDLAARNVLVTHDVHMKISDFGLSRALDRERDYYKCSDTSSELPAPWCAPEALMHRKFSEKSDVWSYGVTLWEIFSYGQVPTLCPIEELPRQLHQGKRLRMPKACSEQQEVFRLMLFGCWQYYEHERKSFDDIVATLMHIQQQLPAAASSH